MKSHTLAAKLLEMPDVEVAIPVENKEKEYSPVVDIAKYEDENTMTLVLQTGHFEHEKEQLDMTGFITDFKNQFS